MGKTGCSGCSETPGAARPPRLEVRAEEEDAVPEEREAELQLSLYCRLV